MVRVFSDRCIIAFGLTSVTVAFVAVEAFGGRGGGGTLVLRREVDSCLLTTTNVRYGGLSSSRSRADRFTVHQES